MGAYPAGGKQKFAKHPTAPNGVPAMEIVEAQRLCRSALAWAFVSQSAAVQWLAASHSQLELEGGKPTPPGHAPGSRSIASALQKQVWDMPSLTGLPFGNVTHPVQLQMSSASSAPIAGVGCLPGNRAVRDCFADKRFPSIVASK